MKKNLISVLILALLVVNVILTGILMFSTMSSVKKTSALVTNIATVLNIELDDGKKEEEGPATVAMKDSVTHDIEELTILLKNGEDGKSHYALVNVAVLMNSAHEDYATYGANIAQYDSVIKSIINEKFQSYTMEELQANQETVKEEILAEIQAQFDSTFVYKVVISSIMFG